MGLNIWRPGPRRHGADHGRACGRADAGGPDHPVAGENGALIERRQLCEWSVAMSVDAGTVRRIAQLARIKVADEEIEALKGELNAILAFVEQLSEVNVHGVEAMTSVIAMRMKERPDVV